MISQSEKKRSRIYQFKDEKKTYIQPEEAAGKK